MTRFFVFVQASSEDGDLRYRTMHENLAGIEASDAMAAVEQLDWKFEDGEFLVVPADSIEQILALGNPDNPKLTTIVKNGRRIAEPVI